MARRAGKEKSMESVNELWQTVLQKLHARPDVSEASFHQWLEALEPVALETDRLELFVKTNFQRKIALSLFEDKIQQEILCLFGLQVRVQIRTEEEQELAANPIPTVIEPVKDTDFSFTNFVVGSSNKFAHAAAQAVANNLGGDYNPLFIYGNSGLGKTHLMLAIRNEIAKSRPDIRILYTKGEDMSNEFIESLPNGTTAEFRAKYRSADLLLVDDVQFIAGKTAVQEEFFHTFDSLHQNGKQIVLTSDRPPKEMASLEARIRGRFESGLIADIQPPDLETRIAIVRRKAQALQFPMPDDIAEYIATQLKTNVRQLEGAILRMQAQYQLTGTKPNITLAQTAIHAMRDSNHQSAPMTMDRIINEVARSLSVSPEDILSQKQSAPVSKARQVAIYVVRNVTNMSLDEIGKKFGGRDHSSMTYSIKRLEERIRRDSSLNALVNDIIKNLSDN